MKNTRIFRFNQFVIEGALPQESSVAQLKKLRKISKKTDIGDKTKEEGANLYSHKNAIDSGIESYQDYMKSNK